MKRLFPLISIVVCGLTAACQFVSEKHYPIRAQVISIDAPKKPAARPRAIGRMERIELVAKGDGKTAPGATERMPAKGENIPDFALTNQDGKSIHLSEYRGRTLLITFIYTRCQLPDFCPQMNEKFCEKAS